MCAHIGRYGINSCIPFDVKDLDYLAKSFGGCWLIYGHRAYSADSGKMRTLLSDCVDSSYHW